MKTPHRRLQRCTWPTSIPRSDLFWKIVRAGVHDQLWQSFFWKGMWKNQHSAVSSNQDARAKSQTYWAAAYPIDSSRGHPELRGTRIENDGSPANQRNCDSQVVTPLVHRRSETNTASGQDQRIEQVQMGRRCVVPDFPTVRRLSG